MRCNPLQMALCPPVQVPSSTQQQLLTDRTVCAIVRTLTSRFRRCIAVDGRARASRVLAPKPSACIRFYRAPHSGGDSVCSQPISSEIQSRVHQGVLEITLNRPDALNSLNIAMHQALQQALRQAHQAEVRAVLLTGQGRGFCAGQDLAEQDPQHPDYDPDLGQTVERFYNPLIRTITQLEKQIICAVNGVAAGAGVSLALACDIVLAARSAKFIQAFAKIGLVPDSGSTWFLPHLIGPARAMALALTAEPVSAEKAQQWGLIWQVTEDDQLLETAHQLAIELAQGPTFSFGLTKQAIHAASTQSLNDQLELEKAFQRRAGFSRDFQEGVQAFLEKRKPNFTGSE